MGPNFPPNLLLFIFAVAFLLALIQIGLLSVAFDKLGLSQTSAFLLLFSSLLGSRINLPLFHMESAPPRPEQLPLPGRFWRYPQLEYTGRTVIAVNVGGGLIPVFFSAYLLFQNPVALWDATLGVVAVSIVSYMVSRPVAGLGIGMPMLVAPASAALMAVILDGVHSAPLAYVSGTLGVLIGADLFRLKDIRRMGAPLAAIGGAGTFDGIFITGIVAVLLT